MRHATRNMPRPAEDGDGSTDGFVIGAVIFAAFMVALFALDGGGNLLGDRFDAGPLTTWNAPR